MGEERLCSCVEKLTAERQPHPAPAAVWGTLEWTQWGPRFKEAPPHRPLLKYSSGPQPSSEERLEWMTVQPRTGPGLYCSSQMPRPHSPWGQMPRRS